MRTEDWKDQLDLDKVELKPPFVEEDFSNIPKYYLSDSIEASKVVAAFQGDNYNIGTALTYLMRAGKKVYVNNSSKDSKVADIKKAINHLNFELDRLNK
jgi:hypothetical protein